MATLQNSCKQDSGSADRTMMVGRCVAHDTRLIPREDVLLQEAGPLEEQREVLASRSVLCRHSAYFRRKLSDIPIGVGLW